MYPPLKGVWGMYPPLKTGFDELDKFGYTILQKPIEALNIVYPIEELDDENWIG